MAYIFNLKGYILLLIIVKLSALASALYFFSDSFVSSVILFITVAGSDIAALYIMELKRRRELERIKDVIKSIRLREFSISEEIKLGEGLLEIQEEIKKMYNQARQDIEYLKRLEKVRTEFLGNVSHELRTPIFAIQGYLETLIDGAIDDPEVNRNFLKKANHHVQNLNNLLNDLIDISMIESGEMHLSFRYFRIEELLTDIYQDLSYQAGEKKLEFIVHPVDKKLQVYGDKNKIKQVLVNLIENSFKYTERGGVEISVHEEYGLARITVKDTGIGIAEKDIPRIFERFYRVDKDRSRTAGGTGLGLAIVKHIIEAHNSKVRVISEIGRGSEFSFTLKT